MSFTKPSTSSNKRKFKVEREEEFFCVASGENVTCLLCFKTRSGVFKGNVRRHYPMERAELLQELKDTYCKQSEEE
ncbi:hypothetical protein L9F63_023317, partial [Diploptera punctata]